MKAYLEKLVEGKNLSSQEAEGAMTEIMEGRATDAQIASFLTALRIKGETIEEITACAKVMREKCTQLCGEGDLMDIVGTGGDCTNTFNVSTLASLVVAAAGVRVAKHGNRSVSSKCGSADVLEALGVKLNLTKEENEQVLAKAGICFMFAPVYHSAMKYVAQARREMGVRTIFNILGPLASPAYANLQVLGVYDEALVQVLAQVLSNLGVKHALVVHGAKGEDEISICGVTKVCEVKGKTLTCFELDPRDYGFELSTLEQVQGDAAEINKEIALAILMGEKGPKRDMVILNAGAALYTALEGISLGEGIELAKEMIDSGKALAKLEAFVSCTMAPLKEA